MPILIVAYDPRSWPLEIPGVQTIDARTYLTQPEYSDMRGVKVFNVCRTYRYQSLGYYVSLLAEARGHRAIPSVTTIQDLKSQTMARFVSEELEEVIQESLRRIRSSHFTLSIYFGRNLAQRHERLSKNLFTQYRAPMLRAEFVRDPKDRTWQLRTIAAIPANEVPQAHWPFVLEAATDYFAGHYPRQPKRTPARFDLAILANPAEADPPSDEKALRRFVKAGEALGLDMEIIGREDYGRVAEFDALFLRETTQVNHHTYRFSRRAASEGLIVIDDPESIVKCSNKVYLAELMSRHDVPCPRTMLVHRGNVDQVPAELGFPCVLKEPDSSFSRGVVKVKTFEEMEKHVRESLEDSDLIIAQEFLPTDFDWRIGILDRRPLYACKYFMAPNHWQIVNHQAGGHRRYGRAETLPVELAPKGAVRAALRVANLIGDGLYGVDVKQSGSRFVVIEVNDNPNIDAGVEDAILEEELYRRIMDVFLRRIELRKARLVIS